MNKKYVFTGETKQIDYLLRTVTLHRIKAVVSFGIIKAGELGGWIEKEENLSHKGDAWVSGNAQVSGHAEIYANARIWDNAKIWGNAEVGGTAKITGTAKIFGNATVNGDAWICDNAEVFSTNHVLVIGAIGWDNDSATFYRDKKNEISVKCGNFFEGKIDKFIKKTSETYGNSRHGLVCQAAQELAKLQIDIKQKNKIEKWIDDAFENYIPEEINVINFELREYDDNYWSIEMIRKNNLEEDSDYAYDKVFKKEFRSWMQKATWEEILDEVITKTTKYINNGRFSEKVKSYEEIGVGFIDGDLTIVYKK